MPTTRVSENGRRRCTRACDNCKRRKERCNGLQPCQRCVERKVHQDCNISQPASKSQLHRAADPESVESRESVEQNDRPAQKRRLPYLSNTTRRSLSSRPVKDAREKYISAGDASNMAFLDRIWRIAQADLGHGALADNPPHSDEAETHCSGDQSLIEIATNPPSKPKLEVAKYLLGWYQLVTSCVLDVFDATELSEGLIRWLDSPPEQLDAVTASYYLVLAIGAQSCPDDRDELAERYFGYGRYVTLTALTEDPSLSTITCCSLITLYLLAGSRMNSAFMYLGLAVRAAYALGLHRRDISALYPPSEYRARERLWKAMRVLDLFLSASLGRPPSTSETRDTAAEDNYSASNDLCLIFEHILTRVYANRTVSPEALSRISDLHRGWTGRFLGGLKTDSIQLDEQLHTQMGQMPNIGLIHLKEAYYWTIMLLSQPFLVDMVSSHIAKKKSCCDTSNRDLTSSPLSLPRDILAQACVDSAIRTIDLTGIFLSSKHPPTRLPFVVNSVFVSTLVLCLALFGDLDQSFPLQRSLKNAQSLLRHFASHDSATKKQVLIVDGLREACDTYIELRARRRMERQVHIIGGLFGTLQSDTPRGIWKHGQMDTRDHCGTILNYEPAAKMTFPPMFHNIASDADSGVLFILGGTGDVVLPGKVSQVADLRIPSEHENASHDFDLLSGSPSSSCNPESWLSLLPGLDDNSTGLEGLEENEYQVIPGAEGLGVLYHESL